MAKKKFDLHCRVCGQTCPCLIYGQPVEHAHSPGGLNEYPLCETHQTECLAVHRPIDAAGKAKWIENCGDPKCGYCKALKAARGL
jgi:hypothetical protein